MAIDGLVLMRFGDRHFSWRVDFDDIDHVTVGYFTIPQTLPPEFPTNREYLVEGIRRAIVDFRAEVALDPTRDAEFAVSPIADTGQAAIILADLQAELD